jgi:DNA mismatch repair protein MutL
MKKSIQLLDDHLINKIAAGEVIERPASVVKELAENSIDAGSSHIAITVEEGGIKRIEVEDNGSGIHPDEIELAFLRHATSKISTEADLYDLHSLGFRGEALPSIASVSRIELYSAAAGETGRRAVFQAGKLMETAPVAYPLGTRFIVEDLFFNTPVRKKYLKSSVTEFQRIHDTVQKLALSRTDISFSFQHNHKHYFKTPGNRSLPDTIASLWGGEIISYLMPVDYQGEALSLHGLISRPDYKQSRRRRQYLFINGRSVFSPMLNKAVEEAYQGLLVSKEFPVTFLYMDIDYTQVDCNVHPQKQQVKFRDDSLLFKVVRDVLRDKLRELFHQVELGAFAAKKPEAYPTRTAAVYPQFYSGPARPVQPEHAALFALPVTRSAAPATLQESAAPIGYAAVEPLPEPGSAGVTIIGQVYRKYILADVGGRFWLVDQHAAHERMHYERILKELNRQGNSQLLLIPQTVELSVHLLELWEQVREDIQSMGFDAEPFGDKALIIRAIPEFIPPEDLDFTELIQLAAEQKQEALFEKIAASLACKKAIKAGENLSAAEMKQLLEKLLLAEDYKHCPHGRPTLLELSEDELDKHFKRQ